MPFGVDPLTVAQTGTSIAMIEKASVRFIPSAMQEMLAALLDAFLRRHQHEESRQANMELHHELLNAESVARP